MKKLSWIIQVHQCNCTGPEKQIRQKCRRHIAEKKAGEMRSGDQNDVKHLKDSTIITGFEDKEDMSQGMQEAPGS